MNYVISHELPTRLRLTCGRYALDPKQAVLVTSLLEMQDGVLSARVAYRSGNIVLVFDNPSRRNSLLAAVKALSDDYLKNEEILAEIEAPPEKASLTGSLFTQIALYFIKKLLPAPVRMLMLYYSTLPRVIGGVWTAVQKGSLSVELLDSASIAISLYRKEYASAQNIALLLTLGETVEEYTRKISLQNLASVLSIDVEKVWRVNAQGSEEEIVFTDLQIGDVVLVRQGAVIPVDGIVVKGDGVVNEATITGEPLPVNVFTGKTLYAGTVLEEGEIQVQVKDKGSNTVVEKIVKQIDESQNLKADTELKISRMADALVPFNFLTALVVWSFTRSLSRTAAVLAVDYSCAIKLATPIAFLSGMREGVKNGFIIKGGKFIENLAVSDTIVFDKTGTLTCAEPRLVEVTPLNGYEREETLKIAACLEEHFPHSVARAVVRRAAEEGIVHQEEHTTVEYVVAHGIVSSWNNQRVLIGSYHFVFEDEKIPLSEDEKKIIQKQARKYSLLYLAIENQLAAVLSIEDAIRPDTKETIARLRELGFKNIYMLTGDEEKTARSIAAQAGIENVYASLLPQDKSKIIEKLKKDNKIVTMVGDGINDTPALSAADIGISMQQGAGITQAVSDITLTESSLQGLVAAKLMSQQIMQKISGSQIRIISGNSLLILLGILGVSGASFSTLAHNGITFLEALLGMRPVLNSKDESKAEPKAKHLLAEPDTQKEFIKSKNNKTVSSVGGNYA